MADSASRKLKILFAASEVKPFSKSGGLGDVAGSLPRALKAAGAEVAVISPKYGTIPQEYADQMKHVADFYVPLSWRSVYCGVEKLTFQGLDFYFIDNEAYFKRDSLYGYFDDGERFAFFSKAICESISKVEELECDVLHCNDWQTAMATVFLREFYMQIPACAHVKTIFSVHNVLFQGQYSDKVLNDILGLADVPSARDQLYCGPQAINYMRGALLYSDLISTVSPTYANELQMPFYGEGMDGIFRRRAGSLSGILNGIDTQEWNPATDEFLPANYSAEDLTNKAECKRALQEEFGLRQDPERPLVCMVGRLTKQKGLDLVSAIASSLIDGNTQLVILGTGDAEYENAFRALENDHKGEVCAYIAYDEALSHQIYAGCDAFLVPSQFEPCGLTQLISMRYGSAPIVRETGGLKDTVEPYNMYENTGNGFTFDRYESGLLYDAINRAKTLFFEDREDWDKMVIRDMEKDVSWAKSAEQYRQLYLDLT